MKSRALKYRDFILTGIVVFMFIVYCPMTIFADNQAHTAQQEEILQEEVLLEGIIDWKQEDGDIQSWIDGALSEQAGNSEWYILALSQYGMYDFSQYESSLLAYLSEHKISSASTRLKYALCLAAIGSQSSYITETMEDAIGKQGIMSWIFGLHLINNTKTEITSGTVIAEILAKQLPDGGWAIRGDCSDADVTAMAVQALAIYYTRDIQVKAAIDKALVFLSERQEAEGMYSSYGVPNAESTAQVLIAISALGIDYRTDTRFIKNGVTLLDGIEQFRLGNGSFCHQLEKGENENATVQVFCALISYLRMLEQKPPFYCLDYAKNRNEAEDSQETDLLDRTEKEETELAEDTDRVPLETKPLSYKVWGSLLTLCIGGILCLVLFIKKKRNYKNFVTVVIGMLLVILFLWVTDFRTAKEYYNGETVSKKHVIGQVTMTIRCDRIVDELDLKNFDDYKIPKDGRILDAATFDIEQGDTVYDILMEAARAYQIQVENDGTAKQAYITGIQYLYEFDFGDLSGWVFRVNDEVTSLGCGEYELSDGDKIEWVYSCELGKDIQRQSP